MRVSVVLGEPADRADVAYAIGKPVGPAVVRNRVRRRLRAAVAELDPTAGTYLIATSPAAAASSYQALRDDLAAALDQAGARPAAVARA